MKNIVSSFSILFVVLCIGLGCKFLKPDTNREITEEPTTTVITRDILKERLGAKGIKTASRLPEGKPNPLTLHLKFSTQNNNFQLNQENYENFGELANTLRQIFKQREENGVFIEGKNEIYKIITLPAYERDVADYNSKNIFVEDFEKLVDDLQKAGFDQIELDINEQNFQTIPDFPIRGGGDVSVNEPKDGKSDSDSTKLSEIKTISGGVVNGKAVDLPKPAYPAAARAVRASGAVNVQVLIDESGSVISANAVSGHPLLRASAVSAARNAKFKPTLLSGKAVKVSGVIVYNFTAE
ncbi:MAG: energy transducer TonB [Pyrinomonadaceae bacterium]